MAAGGEAVRLAHRSASAPHTPTAMRTARFVFISVVLLTLASIPAAHAQDPVYDSLKVYFGDAVADSCHVNVACPVGKPWFNEIGAVARFVSMTSKSGTALPSGRGCTGTFVNNVREDLTPYFLGAAHCIWGDIGQEPNQWYAFQFYWQTPGCNDPPTAPDFTYIAAPARLMVQGPESDGQDFGLLRVNVNSQILTAHKVHFAGWSIEDDVPTQAVIIGHPLGDVKKIVVGENSNPVTFTDSTWTISVETGALRVGQSGSALIDEDHHIVGVTIHGASCSGSSSGNPKLEHFWDIEYLDPSDSTGTTYVALSDFLDPDGTGAQSMLTTANYDLVVSGETFSDPTTDLAAGFFRTAESITAEDDSLLDGGRLHLRARESITITGDFFAEAGGDFLVQIDEAGGGVGSGYARYAEEPAAAPLPALPRLEPNYPNPFRHYTTFRFTVPEPSRVTLTVYDLLGRRVMTLMDGHHEAGSVTLHWTAADTQARPLAAGVYLYLLRVGDHVETGRMTFLGP